MTTSKNDEPKVVADATEPNDAELLESTVFPKDEFPDPVQTPVDLGVEQ